MRPQAPDFDTDLHQPVSTRAKHGLSPSEYQALLNSQGGVCKICKTNNPGLPSWSVDHDHRHCPGTFGCRLCVRGLLCAACNSMLAYARDNPATLREGAAYLERSRRW